MAVALPPRLALGTLEGLQRGDGHHQHVAHCPGQQPVVRGRAGVVHLLAARVPEVEEAAPVGVQPQPRPAEARQSGQRASSEHNHNVSDFLRSAIDWSLEPHWLRYGSKLKLYKA